MRWAIVALALFTAGCAALPPEVRIRFPDWMRGQGFRTAQTPAAAPSQSPAVASVASPTLAPSTLTLPMGDFGAVHAAFTADVARRYAAGMNQSAVVADAQSQGFRCAPDDRGQQVCERLQPIGNGCDDVFVITARVLGGADGDVRRRCPMGQAAPAAPRPTNLLGAPVGY